MCQHGYDFYSHHIHPRQQNRGKGAMLPTSCTHHSVFVLLAKTWLCGHILQQDGSLYPGQACCLLKMDEFYYYGL